MFLATQVVAFIFVIAVLWLPSSEEEQWNQDVIKQVLTSRAKKAGTDGPSASEQAGADNGFGPSGEKGTGAGVSDAKEHANASGGIVTDVSDSIVGDKIKMGASSIKCDTSEIDTAVHRWCNGDGKNYKLRIGPDYRVNKKKDFSIDSLYDTIGMDHYCSDAKVMDVMKRVILPQQILDEYLDDEIDLPTIFVVNIMVPLYPPPNPVWGQKQDDGPGGMLVTYFGMSKETRAEFKKPPAEQSSACRLLRRFIEECDKPGNKINERMKCVAGLHTFKDCGLDAFTRRLAETYNFKPFLTRPKHTFFRGDTYFEMDMDVHDYSYTVRKGWDGMQEASGNVIVKYGFVIEGETNDELPEQMLGATIMCKTAIDNLAEWPF